MTHDLGRIVPVNQTVDQNLPFNLVPSQGPLGGPHFLLLHFDSVSLSNGARLEIDLGYGIDSFSSGAGTEFWTRPVDASTAPVEIKIVGGSGSARLLEYGSGEPTQTASPPGTSIGSRSNPDLFLQTDPYEEPMYETRLECTPDFAWRNANCGAIGVSEAVKNRVESACGIIIMIHKGHVSSCSGTLVGSDLFLTSRHCLTDINEEELRSASVTFDYAPNCDGSRPLGYSPHFFKVIDEVASGRPPDSNSREVISDWVVVRLDGQPGSLPDPLDWRPSSLMNGETIFSMHHPGGSVKKTQTITHDGGTYISGFDFAGGSSGSALFDAEGRLVAGPLSKGIFGDRCGTQFTPVNAVFNTLENPPPPPNPLDVVIVIDRSGSMENIAPPNERTKLEEARDAASLFVQLVREGAGDRLGLVTFSTSSTLNAALDQVVNAKVELVGEASPFDEGQISEIVPNGSTSIGAGLEDALVAMEGTTNDRAILLLSDGQQNTAPMVEDIEPLLGSTRLNVIGFGSDAQIDAPLLGRIAREHQGQFTRAIDGLALRKFFGISFGNMFENGALIDPDHILRANQESSNPHGFDVCGEERITVILGWEYPSAPLDAHIKTPDGKLISPKKVTATRGRTWAFWRIPLFCNGERDGRWSVIIDRVPIGGEFPPPPTDVNYFFLVVCSGGPKLTPLTHQERVYTGDIINPKVGLHYSNRTTAADATVQLTIAAPTRALGELVLEQGLSIPLVDEDTVPSFRATLQTIEKQQGILPVSTSTIAVQLFDDGMHDDGAMEPDGIFNHPMKELTRVEGTYEFRAVATYGNDCLATREAFWAIHVEPGLDPESSDISIVDETDIIGEKQATLVIFPRDKYANPLGPGRQDIFEVSPMPNVTLKGPVKDHGNGSYSVNVGWDSGLVSVPGIYICQPNRPPGLYIPPTENICDVQNISDCSKQANELLECIGLPESDVEKINIKSICLEFHMNKPDC